MLASILSGTENLIYMGFKIILGWINEGILSGVMVSDFTTPFQVGGET
jgi:hypothetical protein